MKSLKELLPRASKSFIAANSHLEAAHAPKSDSRPIVGAAKAKRRGLMNRTEREFAMILEAQRRNNEIASFEFEGITLRFAGVRYTADFAVFPPALCVSGQIKLIEIKGGYIKGKFERAVERFRHAKTYYGDRFLFELWQKTKAQGWIRLL